MTIGEFLLNLSIVAAFAVFMEGVAWFTGLGDAGKKVLKASVLVV